MQPSLLWKIICGIGVLLLFVGALAFAFQIYADFSAYTDIARAVARMLGFELIENFRAPYSAISPSDFWRRWHISFSSWIRDYLYIPLGGSRVKTSLGFLAVLLASLGLSGLWHGAAWNFVLWGIYHALLVFGYHRLGLGGRWTPKGRASAFASWTVMFTFTLFGWLLFRMPSLDWLTTALSGTRPGWSGEELVAGVYTLSLVLAYALPLLLLGWIQRMERPMEGLRPLVQGAFYGAAIVAMIVLAHDGDVDFIYFLF
ncbi:MAG: MBOAT family O-acyltransferase [Planctomycetota bacterium]